MPALPRNELVARLCACSSRADVGEISAVRPIGELHVVVTSGHVRHMQDLRSFTEVQPADHKERIAVHASRMYLRNFIGSFLNFQKNMFCLLDSLEEVLEGIYLTDSPSISG